MTPRVGDPGFPTHSSLIGGSTAARLIACPASYATLQQIPDAVETPSIYAEIGTAQHEAAADMISRNLDPADLLGRTYNRVELSSEHVTNLQVVADFVNPMLTPDAEFLLETRVTFPGIDGAFGTLDFAVRKGPRLVLADWKFGSGVFIPAYGEKGPNAQLMFYAAGLRNTAPDLFRDVPKIDLSILQPAFSVHPDTITITLSALDAFVAQVHAAVAEALSAEPRRARGPWCRFAACKLTCPLWTGALLDLSAMNDITASGGSTDYGEVLAEALAIAELVEPWVRDVRSQGHSYLENGGVVPGWKLVPKRSTRSWANETVALAALAKAGFNTFDIVILKSPAAVEKVGKAAKLTLPKEAVIATASSGSTLAPADDPRAEKPGLGAAIDLFRRAVAGLKGPN